MTSSLTCLVFTFRLLCQPGYGELVFNSSEAMATSYSNVALLGDQGAINQGYLHQPGGATPFQPMGNAPHQVALDKPETTVEPSIASKSALGFTYRYTPLPPILRRIQIALYIFSFLQLLVAGVAVCVFVHSINDWNHNEAPDIDILVINAFLFGCSVVGLMAASGRSRIVLGAFIVASLLVLTQSCLLLNFLNEKCKEKSYSSKLPWECTFGKSSYGLTDQDYTDSRYMGMIANLALSIVVAIGGSLCSTAMLAASFKTNDVRP